jgi:hypothetical protein
MKHKKSIVLSKIHTWQKTKNLPEEKEKNWTTWKVNSRK